MPGSLAFLFAICALCLHQQTAQACSCYPTHPQMKFCSSDIVVRVKVVEENKEPSQDKHSLRSYTVILMKMYRPILRKHIIKVYTPFSGAACGIFLKKNTEYVLGGNINGQGRFMVRLCNLVLEWNLLTFKEKYHIKHSYKKGCGCQIKWCQSFPCTIATQKECLWTDRNKRLACLPCKDGTCQWNCNSPFPKQGTLQNTIEP